MFRTHAVVTFALVLGASALVFPACSSSDEAAPACANGTKDEGEDGIDCGGTCTARCTGAACTAGAECASGTCTNGACAAPATKTCGVGAARPTCGVGEACELDKDCGTGFCDGSTCAEPPAGSHTDGKKNGGETGIDCGGSVKDTQPCADGQGCLDNTDCVGTCTASVCGPIGPTDGKKNNGETDIDCGGANAPKCVNGKACAANADCTDDYCPEATLKCTAPRYDDGVRNGTETDVDCGGSGTGMERCAETKACLVDTDCNGACNYKKQCVDAPSCKNQFGSDTCGGGIDGSGEPATHTVAGGGTAPGHESCCRSLPVAGYTDPNQPGKTVYLDKYEITAGRMRAFLESLGGGVDAAGNAKPANVKAYIETHVPSRWNNGWNNVLPTGNAGANATYVVASPTADLLYPGQDVYVTYPKPGAQAWTIASGTYNVDFGVFSALGAPHFYPETVGGTPVDYGASHALNCANGIGSYGYSTYWFDNATVATYGYGPNGKFYSKNELDIKALTCSPFALLAAFCAWDGGQLATAEVVDNVTGNTVSPVYSTASQNGKLAPGNSQCGNGLITYSDGGTPCAKAPYDYPPDLNNTWDGSARIPPPGRIPTDTVAKNVGDEPWMDMIGNLHEAVFKAGETMRFDYRGYGAENNSILYHRMQYTTPRGKGGAMGGRCMRFK